MSSLNLHNVAHALARQVIHSFASQITAPDHADYGGVVRADWGLADHGTTAGFIASTLYLYLAQLRLGTDAPQQPDAATLLSKANLAADYLLRIQRPTGRIDLLDCNFDSSPDAGFVVQLLCPVIEMARPLTEKHSQLAEALQKVERFTYRAAVGILDGGFHTPNHRWVMVSALAQANRLFSDLDADAVIKSYLAEGFDIDPEGAFIEHSAGVYDAICDLSLFFIGEYWDCPEALPAARANLELDLHLMHADGSVETGLSRRQDYGTRSVPLHLAVAYLVGGFVENDARFFGAAAFLWEKAVESGQAGSAWLCYPLLKYGDPPISNAELLPTDFARFFPHNGIWRVRRDLQSATFFRGTTHLLSLIHGKAELSAVKISQSYFGAGRFVAERLEVVEGKAVLRSEGQSLPRRPGYDYPLGQPVPPEQWAELRATREYRPLPPCVSTLTVEEIEGGFACRYQTLEGEPGVPAQIAFDFPPGGIWETEGVCFKPEAGQVIFLKQGAGRMRYGDDVVEIAPGADAHRTWNMRDTESAPGHVRVLFTFRTPVDHSFCIRSYRSRLS